MKINNILLDQDGVIADFITPCIKRMNEELGENLTLKEYVDIGLFNVDEVYGISEKRFWEILEKNDTFWSSLNPFPWSKKLVEYLSEIAPITVCTSPSDNPKCFEQKSKWLLDFGFEPDQIMIGKRKYLMANRGNVLIDDFDRNIKKFENANGHAILVPSTWNTHNLTFEKIKDVIDTKIKNIQNNIL
jgi:5'(3')-deoxyribonucleotidase